MRQREFKDCEVIERAALDRADQLNHRKAWLVQFSDGSILEYDTEEEALATQRHWRRMHLRDPQTGAAA
jgi:uncharacterized phage-like protein YoqJ